MQPLAPRLAFPALIVANLFLAAGPWMVRLTDVGPVAAGFWRLALALPLLAALAVWQQKGKPLPAWSLVGAVVIGGLFFAADLAAWHVGILQTKLANATLFGNFASFLFAIYGFILLRRLPDRVQGGAVLLAVLGTFLLLGSSYELSPDNLVGDLFCLLAGLFYTFYLVAVDRARRSLAPFPTLAIATAAGTLPILLFAILLGEQVMPGDWGPVILLSIGSQLIGQSLLVFAMGHLSPVVTGLGLLTQPIAAAAIGWGVYGERLGAVDLAGALLICVGLVLIRLPQRGLATNPSEDH
ncbi:DMT family transporter [Sphingosinicella sp. YJ22]|uniref:DMT family transporter n=1 Tax=Sphingosinicella sp. YJ22 TaxID=1104780 RepID=UPI00140B19AC|nr:DMT family transporter [Sphingosinicella sp. YJ22]